MAAGARALALPALAVAVGLVAAAAAPGAARAQQPTQPAIPRPGSDLDAPLQQNPVERLAPVEPPALSAPLAPPPEPAARTGPGAAATLRLGRVGVAGNAALPDAALLAAAALSPGEAVTLARIEEARLAVLRAYRDAGYPFVAVEAGLTQRPDGAADLALAVTEGYVAEVRLEGDIGPAGTQVLRFLDRARAARPVTTAAVERALLLASDIPGVTVRGVLRPLPEGGPGALRLVAQVSRKPVSGYLNADNRGFRLTGAWQGLLVAGANAFTEYGERAEVALFTSEGLNQTFGQASVEAFLGGSGLRVRLYAGAGRAEPGSTLAAIGYRGDTTVGGVAAFYPLVRSRPANLYAVGQFDVFDSTVETGFDPTQSRLSRDGVRVLRAGLDGQALDSFLPFLPGGATTTGGFRVSQGVEILGSSRTGATNVARLGSRFDFLKVAGEASRVQPLFVPYDGALVSFAALAQGQYSEDVLPTSEKLYLGGSRLGRGFYAGQVTGDTAFGLALEIQLDLPVEPVEVEPGGVTLRPAPQLYVFRDLGRTWENLETDRNRRLSSWGGGLRLPLTESLQFDLEGVVRTTRRPEGEAADRLRETAVFFRTLVRF